MYKSGHIKEPQRFLENEPNSCLNVYHAFGVILIQASWFSIHDKHFQF